MKNLNPQLQFLFLVIGVFIILTTALVSINYYRNKNIKKAIKENNTNKLNKLLNNNNTYLLIDKIFLAINGVLFLLLVILSLHNCLEINNANDDTGLTTIIGIFAIGATIALSMYLIPPTICFIIMLNMNKNRIKKINKALGVKEIPEDILEISDNKEGEI